MKFFFPYLRLRMCAAGHLFLLCIDELWLSPAAVVLALWRSASEGRSLPRCQVRWPRRGGRESRIWSGWWWPWQWRTWFIPAAVVLLAQRSDSEGISSSLLLDHRGVLSCVISSPVSLTERFRKEGRYAGRAHLFGKAVTRGKKGRSSIRGSTTCTRAPGAVCEAMSSVRLKCSSMAFTFCVLVECQKRQEYQTTSSSSTVVGEVIKRLLHTWGDIAQLDTCIAVVAASVNVCWDVFFIPPMLCLLCIVGAWCAARTWCACCLREPRAWASVMNS